MSEKKFPIPEITISEQWPNSSGMRHTFSVYEEQRQVILLALAELSIARPGWVGLLDTIALEMDNIDELGHAEMFEQFRRNHSNPLAEALRKS